MAGAFDLNVNGEGKSDVRTGANVLEGIGASNFYFGGNPTAALVFNRTADIVQGIPAWAYAAAIGGAVLLFYLRSKGRR